MFDVLENVLAFFFLRREGSPSFGRKKTTMVAFFPEAMGEYEERITIARKTRVRAGAALDSAVLGELGVGTQLACYDTATLESGLARVAVGPAVSDS